MALFLSRIWTSHQVRPENFIACSAEAFNLVCPAFRRIELFGAEFWYATLDLSLHLSFFQSRNCSLSTLTFRPLAGFSSPTACGYTQYCHAYICFKTCNHDTWEDADNHTTIFYILPIQRIWALFAGLASRLFERSSSVCHFPRRYRRGCLPFTFSPSLVINGWFEARYSCVLRSFGWCLSDSRGMRLQESPFEQDPICLPLKALSCLPLGEGILSLSFSYDHTLCNLALNPTIFTSLNWFNMQFHTDSQSVIISSSSRNFLTV